MATPVDGLTWPGLSRNQRSAPAGTLCATAVPALPMAVVPGSEMVTVIDAPEPLMMFSSAPFAPMSDDEIVSGPVTAAAVTVVAELVTEVAVSSAIRRTPFFVMRIRPYGGGTLLTGRDTVPGMTAERDDEIVAAYADNTDPAAIGRVYGLPTAEVERIIAAKTGVAVEQPESRWSLNHTGNRVLVAVLVGIVVEVFAGLLGAGLGIRVALWAITAFVTYMLATNRR